jgi:hypothetical protein
MPDKYTLASLSSQLMNQMRAGMRRKGRFGHDNRTLRRVLRPSHLAFPPPWDCPFSVSHSNPPIPSGWGEVNLGGGVAVI